MSQVKKQFKKKPSTHKYFGASVKARYQRFRLFPVKERVLRAFLMAAMPTQEDDMATLIPLIATGQDIPEVVTVCVGMYHRGFQEQLIDASVVSQCALEGYSARRIMNVLNVLQFENENGTVPALAIDSEHTDVIVPLYSTLAFVAQAVHIVVTGQDITHGIFQYPVEQNEEA